MKQHIREAVTDRILSTMQQVITIQQNDALEKYLREMSDYEFDKLTVEMLLKAQNQKPLSNKEYMELLEKVRKANHITDENTAMNCVPLTYLDDKENEEMWRDISRSKPSDHIHLKAKDDQALCSLWQQSCSLEKGRIPSDLFFAGKIPLHDCMIVVDERDRLDGKICPYRVVVFPDYKERIRDAGEEPVYVAAIVLEHGGIATFIPIVVQEGVDMIGIGYCGHHGVTKAQVEASRQRASMQDITNMAYSFMETWYGIQVALLHPSVQEVFRHPRIERVFDPEPRKPGKQKRIARYVKKHVINADEVRRAVSGPTQEYTRHTLVWYVIGHWRHYSNGKRVFIQPYWKGAMRHLKMDLDGRERIIVIGEESN